MSKQYNTILLYVLTALLGAAALLSFVLPAYAQPTPTINYQGKLTDSSGVAVADGSYNMRFWLLQSTGQATTSAVWTESLTGANQVDVVNGLFSVMLGSTSALSSVDFNQPLYLGVEIGGTGAPSWDGEMLPRKPLGTVPAAFEATQLGGVASSSFLRSDAADSMDAFLTLTAGALTNEIEVSGTATTTNLVVGSDFINDLTGVGLIITGNALSVSSSSLNLTVAGLSDTTITTPQSGQLFSYNGSNWVNVATSTLGVALSDTTGTLAATRGGTGLSTITENQLLIGGAGNTWTQIATSALGIDTSLFTDGGATTYLTATGDSLGIGTTSADAKLDVWGDARFGTDSGNGNITVRAQNGFNTQLTFDTIGGSNDWDISAYHGVNQLHFETGPSDTTVMMLDGATQNVGIGTTSPTTLLTVGSSTPGALQAGDYYNSAYIAGSLEVEGVLYDTVNNSAGTDGMVLQTTGTGFSWVATSTLGLGGGSSLFTDGGATTYLTATGDNFGIGTTSTDAKLDVWGDFRVGTSSTPTFFARTDNGRIGIGTDSPGRLVDIVSDRPVIAMTDTDTNSVLRMSYDTANGSFQFEIDDTSQQTGSDFNVQIDGTTYFTFEEGGQLGIGDTTPDQMLEISTSSNPQILLKEGGVDFLRMGVGETASTSVIGFSAVNDLLFGVYSSGSDTSLNSEFGRFSSAGDFMVDGTTNATLYVDASSNRVGIGSSTPAYDLSVEGSIYGDGLFIRGANNVDNYFGRADTISGGTPTNLDAQDMFVTGGNNNDLAIASQGNTGNEGLLFGNYDGSAFTEYMRIDAVNGGNVGIGTTSPNAKLSLDNTAASLDGAGVAGLDQYLLTENSSDGAVQYGNRYYLNASNTATTTIVGSIYRLADDTTFGNTVRALEVQANRGANTNGENTALSGFGRTFGVRGVTNANAGGTFEPAGGFFETEGATQGNAIRGYSSSITTASLLSLFQDTSNFQGTGLEMNFGNTTGDFSSTSSKYLDFQNAGTSVFTVSAFGTTTIGDGTTNNQAGLQIGYGGICVDNDGTCVASTTGRITSVESQTGNSDLAEMYFSSQDLEPGEVVVLYDELSVRRATAGSDMPVLGVVSTKPGLTLGFDDQSTRSGERGFPLALKGRVPVKLSTENGPIKAGDSLMLSSLPGVAMKADGTGTVVGIALEDFNDNRMYSDTYINQFGDDIAEPDFTPITINTDPRINDGCYYGGGGAAGEAPCTPLETETVDQQVAEANELAEADALEDALRDLRYVNSDTRVLADGTAVSVGQIVMFVDRAQQLLAPDQLALFSILMGTSSLSDQADEDEPETVFDRLVALADNFVAGVLSVFELRADRVETSELCVDGVCVNANDLKALLEAANNDGQIVEVSIEEPEPEDHTEEEPEELQDHGNIGGEESAEDDTDEGAYDGLGETSTTTIESGSADEAFATSTEDVTTESGEETATENTEESEETMEDESVPEATEEASSETEPVSEPEVEDVTKSEAVSVVEEEPEPEPEPVSEPVEEPEPDPPVTE